MKSSVHTATKPSRSTKRGTPTSSSRCASDFDKQLHDRLELAEREKRDAIALAEAKIADEMQSTAARKDAEIQALQAQLAAGEVARKLAVAVAVAEAMGVVSEERDGLANELEQARSAQQAAAQLAEAKLAHELQGAAAKKDFEIQALQARLEAGDVARQLAVNEAAGVVALERDGLKNDLNLITVKNQLEEKTIKEQYALQLRDRDGEIVRLRDMKARLSTKMVGETLEQHCEQKGPVACPSFSTRWQSSGSSSRVLRAE